tara:strand:- start:1759 stop:1932 length:174 start_codon:yes stop_codon:yes gene_type:complete
MVTGADALHLFAVQAFVYKIANFSLGLAALAAGPVFFGGNQPKAMGALDGHPSEYQK